MTETPGPLKGGVCLHCLDHWTAEDWQAMTKRIRESEERLRELLREQYGIKPNGKEGTTENY